MNQPIAARVTLLIVAALAVAAVWAGSTAGAHTASGDAFQASDCSPSPSASSPSPSPSPSPTPSCPPTPTSSPPPGRTPRTLTLHASRDAVRAGSSVTLFGFLDSTARCAVGETVEIQRRIVGPNERWTEHKIEVTDASGEFESVLRIWKNAEYKALVRRDRFCQREESTSVLVNARVRVRARVDDHTPEQGSNFRIFGRVRPAHDGTEIHLQWRRNGRWRTVFSQQLSDRSTFSFFPLADWDRRKVRIKWPRGDFDHIAGYSRVFIIRTHS